MFGGASSFSGKVDAVFLYIAALTIAFLVFITFVMITFVIRYRRGKAESQRTFTATPCWSCCGRGFRWSCS